MRLEKKLDCWEEQSLISSEQKKQIIEFEKNNQKPLLAIGMTLLGIFTIALGVISVVAANWDIIPPLCKIVLDLILLAGVALGTFQAWQKNKNLWFEGGLVGLFMLCGASIGLIGQVFQTNGSFPQWGMFWCFITLPLLVISRRKILPFLWMGLLVCSIFNTEIFQHWLEIIFHLVLFVRFQECWLVFLLLVGGILVWIFSALNQIMQPKHQIFTVAIFYSYLLIYGVAIAFMLMAYVGSYMFFINTYFILFLLFLGMAFWGEHIKCPRMVNGNIAALYVLFLMIYFRLFGSLMITGIGLIINGLVIIGGLKLARKVMKAVKNMNAKESGNAKI